jgi:hypothetical protein
VLDLVLVKGTEANWEFQHQLDPRFRIGQEVPDLILKGGVGGDEGRTQ